MALPGQRCEPWRLDATRREAPGEAGPGPEPLNRPLCLDGAVKELSVTKPWVKVH